MVHLDQVSGKKKRKKTIRRIESSVVRDHVLIVAAIFPFTHSGPSHAHSPDPKWKSQNCICGLIDVLLSVSSQGNSVQIEVYQNPIQTERFDISRVHGSRRLTAVTNNQHSIEGETAMPKKEERKKRDYPKPPAYNSGANLSYSHR